MSQLSLFDSADDPLPPQAARLAPKLRALAKRGVFFGSSSWKYEGWLGSIYTPDKYTIRGKFSKRKFEAECLREYAKTFPIVGGDFSFYQFPSPDYWDRLFGESPDSLRFGLKVPEDITVPRWPKHARYGKRAGLDNPHFLDPHLLATGFLKPLAPYSHWVATVMLEFGTLAKSTFATLHAFLERLGPFLDALPRSVPLAIEIRNPEYLGDPYFSTLAERNVAHVFNAWTRMPALEEQAAMTGAFTADFSVVRALLTKGHAYAEAVDDFQPYRAVQRPNPSARVGLYRIVRQCLTDGRPIYTFVNNRLEGNAPGTIEAVADELS